MLNSQEVLAIPNAGVVKSVPRILLRLEGLAVLIAATFGYSTLHGSWWLYGGLFFVPDIAFLAYLSNPRIGSITYNSLHSYIGPLVLALAAEFATIPAVLPFALIWTAHIGFDRAMGYGLKYGSAFGDTHLGRK